MRSVGIIIQGPISHLTIPFLKKNVSYLDEFFPNYDIVISTKTKDEEWFWCGDLTCCTPPPNHWSRQ